MFIHVSVNATRANQEAWGDTHFARSLILAIQRIPGCDGALLFRDDPPPPPAEGPAAVLRILGPHLEEPVPDLPNLLWIISPPNLAPTLMLQRYQAVFCGSAWLAEQLCRQGVAATYLPQATDTSHFRPDRTAPSAPRHDICFVGAYAPRADRRIVLKAVEAGFEPHIWGPGWKGIVPDRLWLGERLDLDELADVYAAARIVLNSHMPHMAAMGFMSNRSYDALASGALVVSDQVAGFSAPDLPELMQIANPAELVATLERILAAPPRSPQIRQAQHQRLAARHDFAARAAIIVAAARHAAETGLCSAPAFRPGQGGPVDPPRLTDPAASGAQTQTAVLDAAEEVLAICRYLEQPDPPALTPPPPARSQGIIHPFMADLRDAQAIACAAPQTRQLDRIATPAARARRLTEVLRPPLSTPLDPRLGQRLSEHMLERISLNLPLWHHTPDGFRREGRKVNLRLWPRRTAPALRPAVILHLYYADLAPVLAERLARIPGEPSLYVSTDTDAKAAAIRAAMPRAEVRILENRGRDILPKLYGFRDVHHRHEIVLHLHGKKSLHSGRLDDWLTHVLDCLLGSEAEICRILSFFQDIPRLGMVMPSVFRDVLSAAHWGSNRGIARELAHRMGLSGPLPPDGSLRFPVGSMFWARSAALKPLLDLDLGPQHFPPEAGQLDGTLAHAIERMLGVACIASGYHLLPVLGAESRLHMRYQKRFSSNGELRTALRNGVFDV